MTSLPAGVALREDRLESLYRIGRLLGEFESLEGTFDEALGIVAGTLPLCSAMVIEDRPGDASLIGWHAASHREPAVSLADRNVRSLYASLVGAPDEWRPRRQVPGPTPLPAVPASSVGTFIVVPLLVVDGPIFGALQLECSGVADEGDLRFVAAVGSQLAVAIERRRSAAAEGERRARAEATTERYEGLVDRLDQTFVWEADRVTLVMHYVSAGADAILGYPLGPGVLRETERWTDHVHHEDRAGLTDALRRAAVERRPQEVQHRCVLFSGEVRWFHTRVHLSDRPDGEPDTLQGISSDITALRAVETRVRERLDFTRTLNASLGEGLIALDLQGCVTFCNATALDLLGCGELDILTEDLGRALRIEDADGGPVSVSVTEVARTGGGVRSDRHLFRRKDGRTFPASYRLTPLRRSGHVAGALLAFEDVTERRRGEDARRFIHRALVALGTSLEPGVALEALARAALPRLGDLCFIDVAGPDDTTRRVAWAHVERRRRLEDDEMFGPEPPAGSASAFARETEGEVQGVRMGSVTQATSRADLTRRLRARSTITVPLVLDEGLVGEMTFCFTTSRREHGEEERSLAHELARPVALAIEHDNRFRRALRAVKEREASLAVVAHDLRTPLVVIALSARKLGVRPPGPEDMTTFRADLLRVQRSAERLIASVEDLVDAGSMATGRFNVRRRMEHHPIVLLGEAVASFGLLPLDRGVTLVFEAAAALPVVSCDRERILQVFSNLIGNAVTVSPPGGVITLRASERAREVVFSVADTGPGVADVTRLFERHWRGSQVGTRGGGLGLTIAKGIIDAHGGQIWAESAVGLGTTFSFTLARAGPASSSTEPSSGP